jgi:multisubunit Na+/H+ antiporter MnhB subunit
VKIDRNIVAGLAAAALMLGVTLALRLLHVPDGALRTRAVNVLAGLMAVFLADRATKALTPLSRLSCAPEREQRLRRRGGFLLVGGGLLFVLAWLAAPLDLAVPLSTAALGGAVLLTLALVVDAARPRKVS